jgi:hypothetical protein
MISNNILKEARRRFLKQPGIIGVGWGPKLRAGKVVAHQSIVVFVDSKVPIEVLPPEQVIPDSFNGVPTDVRVPQIAPAADPQAPPGSDMCLTDHTWIDWGKIERRRVTGTQER